MIERVILILVGIGLILYGVLSFPTNQPLGLVAIGAGVIVAGFGGSASFVSPAAKVTGGTGFVLIVIGALMAWVPHP